MQLQLRPRANIAALLLGAAAAGVFLLARSRRKKSVAPAPPRSGASIYESRRAVDEYLLFHFGPADVQMPYAFGPREALDFPARCAKLCAKHARGGARALDLGCAVGGATFELARSFQAVLGLDYSHAFIAAAQELKASGAQSFQVLEEGAIYSTATATVAADVDRARVSFGHGDACALPASLGTFDAVLCGNLLCRLPDPMALLKRLPSLVHVGGVVVLVSPYSWLEEYTDRSRWFGGRQGDGRGRSFEEVRWALDGPFHLVLEQDMPFLIREHARKFQWGCSHCSVWQRVGAVVRAG